MRILIFGDLHLSTKFNQAKFNKIVNLVNSVDEVIINGDFWDSAYCNFDEFTKSKWNQLFPVLKRKSAIYLYGNHDKKEWCDDRVTLFSVKQGKTYEIDFSNHKVYAMHGDNQVYGSHWQKMPDWLEKFLWRIGNVIEGTLVKIFGKHFLKWYHKGTNNRFKEAKLKEFGVEPLVFYNHTHAQERDDKTRCHNTGCMKYGLFQYVIFDTKTGDIEFYDESY